LEKAADSQFFKDWEVLFQIFHFQRETSMNTFLFTAVNRDGKAVTERVEAENLAQARYKLEIRGYSEITFFESELSGDITNLFDEKQVKNQAKFLKQQVGAHYDTTLRRHFINVLKYTWFWWLMLLYLVYANQDLSTVLWFGGSVLVVGYLTFPSVIFNRLHEAHCWDKNGEVRFWGHLAKFYNRITFVKIPALEIDIHLACADAREGDLTGALRRIAKYQNDPKVSERLYKLALIRLYGNAREFDKVLNLLENSLDEGHTHTEELLDYAICLARRHKQTARAKGVLEKVFDTELTAMANLFIPYCQGVIEVEDGNYSQAEFYLKRAAKQLEPFKRNTFAIGLKSEVNAFLAMALGNQGEKDEAAKLYEEAKPYLLAVRENELLERCESVLR
jgi:hypothetical protein